MKKGKLDAFDFVIKVLRDHEKNLDNLIERLETLLETLSTLIARLEYIYDKIEQPA